MNQIERIEYYEAILDEAQSAVSELSEALEHYQKVQEKIRELESYYSSPLWRKDYEDDEKGRLPANLKRGVLSEDAVYHVLEENSYLLERIKERIWVEGLIANDPNE